MSHHPAAPGREPPSRAPVRLTKGLFYADVTHPASDRPLRIALHGVRSYEEAARALSILNCSHAPGHAATPVLEL
jgi:hypothetical protein